ncbi:peptidoglycan editing factor PgeF [Tengunoibacter tsumagoiensis]|uniref:Purine nucleoside phosphorylase n=1 Tax=Tengunoibacter tsumagoiensis TaxID=2014871 RepID=A0A402A4N6_9CHLR|nr:peptidoglycan editing factor PgeF [Tengunoibacter tsumagoiensis]GCE14117.1 laccase domain protein [Tengunoibacter tsumagoiensis]
MIEQQLSFLQFDLYQQFPELTHGVFTRLGGVSQAPYASLNTSTPPRGVNGDSINNVIHNRQLALRALDLPVQSCITLWQIHGADVITYRSQDEWRTDWADHSYYERSWTPATIRKGDALITHERSVTLALSFADCVPLLFYAPQQRVIALAHGGWRGTARGIAIATVEAMQQQYGCQKEQIYAGIGPAIGSCCYEVSSDLQEIFSGRLAFDEMPTRIDYLPLVRESAVFSRVELPERTSLRLDLQATHRNQLMMIGIPEDQIETMQICTSCHTEQFFSHRREQGKTGRFVVLMSLKKSFPSQDRDCTNLL